MDDDSFGFSQKGEGVPRGIDSSAEDANPSPESGGARLGAPVWRQFVANEAFQEEQKGAIAAEQAYQSRVEKNNQQIQHQQGEVWGGDNGWLRRKVGRQIEQHDANGFVDHPALGALARKSLWDKEVRAAKTDASNKSLELQDPSKQGSRLSQKQREETAQEISLYEQNGDDLSKKEAEKLKIKLAKADEIDRKHADAYAAKVRAAQLEQTDPESWWASRVQPSQREQTVGEVQAKRPEIDAAEDSALREMADLRKKLASGVKGPEVDAIQAKMAELASVTSLTAEKKQENEAKLEPVKQEAAAVAAKPKPFFGFADAFSGIWDAVKGLGTTAPAAFYQLTEGMERPDKYSDSAKAAFAAADAYNKEMQAKSAAGQAAGTSTSVGESFREAGGSLGFSLGSMAAAVPASIVGAKAGGATGAGIGALFEGVGAVPGAAIGATVGGVGAGMAASGTAAYRMAGAQFLDEAFKNLEAESQRKSGRPMNEQEKQSAFEALLPIAKNTALWEAGPEAVGNAVTLGAGKIIFGLGKPLAAKFAKTIAGKAVAGAGAVATELGTETLTQVEQSADQKKAEAIAQGQDPNAIKADWSGGGVVEAFKEVAPQTLALMGLMGGAGGAVKIASKVTGIGGQKEDSAADPVADLKTRVDSHIASIDPEAAPATPAELGKATLIHDRTAGAVGLGEAVLIERDLAGIEQEDTDAVATAQDALDATRAVGGDVKAAETALEETKAKAGRADRARAVLKINHGQSLSDLTDAEVRSLGLTRDAKPVSEAELKAVGLDRPLVVNGPDESPIILDEAIARVKAVSPRAGEKIPSEAKQIERANTPVWTVTLGSGKTVTVRAPSATEAETKVAGDLPMGADTVVPGSAKPYGQDNQGQTANQGEAPPQVPVPAVPVGAGGSTNNVPAGGVAPVVDPAKAQAENAVKAAKKLVARAKKNKRLSTVLKEVKGKNQTRPDSIEVNPEKTVTDAISAGMTPEKALQYFGWVLDEEIRHLAQYDAARTLWEKAGSPGEFTAWKNAHYGAIWQTEFVATGKADVARTIYAKGSAKEESRWEKMSDADKAFEAIRMMSQGENVTEAAKLWINIGQTLRDALEAALAALKQFVDTAPPAILSEIKNLENALKQLRKQDLRNRPKKPASVQTGAGNSVTPQADGDSGTGGNGGVEPTPSNGVGAFADGQKVSFVRDGEELTGVVSGSEKNGMVIVRLDRPTHDGLPTKLVRVGDLRLVAQSKPSVSPESEKAPVGETPPVEAKLKALRDEAAKILIEQRGFDPDDAAEYVVRLGGEKELSGFIADNTTPEVSNDTERANRIADALVAGYPSWEGRRSVGVEMARELDSLLSDHESGKPFPTMRFLSRWNNGLNAPTIKIFFREAGIPSVKGWSQKGIKQALEDWARPNREAQSPAPPPAPQEATPTPQPPWPRSPKAESASPAKASAEPTAPAPQGAGALTPAEQKARDVIEGLFAADLPDDARYMKAVENGDMETAQRMVDERLAKTGAFWHGTPSGDLRGGMTGLHVGTKQAAMQALEARIGIPADGKGWNGDREYGSTLLAGKDRINSGQFGQYRLSGFNVDAPNEDYYATKMPVVGNGVPVDPTWKPWIRPVLIVGEMTNNRHSPISDEAANRRIKRKRGAFYKNEGEDSGSISAVLPDGGHVRVKLADPVTRDAQGNVIPLSQRFNPASESILYAAELPDAQSEKISIDEFEKMAMITSSPTGSGGPSRSGLADPISPVGALVSEAREEGIEIGDGGELNTTTALFAADLPDWERKLNKNKAVRTLYGENGIRTIMAGMRKTQALFGEDLSEMPDEVAGSPLRDNQDRVFKKTFDLSTVCPRQDQLLAILGALERERGEVFTSQQRFMIGLMMKDGGIMPACWYCYGQSGRNSYDAKIAEATEAFNAAVRLISGGGKLTDKALDSLLGTWKSATLRNAFKKLAPIAAKNGLELDPVRIRDLAKNDQATGLEGLIVKELKGWAQAASLANKAKGFSPYTNQIQLMSERELAWHNAAAGLRLNSQTDLRPWHVIDTAQMFTHLGARGGMAHVYTRVPEFFRIFGDTGLRFNLSIDVSDPVGLPIEMRTDDMTLEQFRSARKTYGEPVWDDMNGIRHDDAMKFRKNPNVGTMLVAISEYQVWWGLESNKIDMIIPYHRGAVPKETDEFLGTKDFSREQHEVWSDQTKPIVVKMNDGSVITLTPTVKKVTKTVNGVKKTSLKWEMPPITREQHHDNHARYLELAEKAGFIPRFKRFSGRLVNGKIVGGHPNYMKLVRDVARTDTKQTPVDVRKLNWKRAQKWISEWLDKGGVEGDTKPDPAMLEEVRARIEKNEWPKPESIPSIKTVEDPELAKKVKEQGPMRGPGVRSLQAADLPDINPTLANEARTIQQWSGKNVSDPRFAAFGSDATRKDLDVVTAIYDYEREQRSNAEALEVARKRLAQDPADIEAKLVDSVTTRQRQLDTADHLAIQLMIDQETAAAGNDTARQAANMARMMAYRKMRGDVGRLLQIGVDRFMKPEERALAALTDAIYTPSKKLGKLPEQMPRAEKEAIIKQECEKRIAAVQKALDKLGLKLSDIREANQRLKLQNSELMKEVLKLRTSLEQDFIKLIQKGWTLPEIVRRYGRKVGDEVQAALSKARADLAAKLTSMMQQGMTDEEIRAELGDSLKAASLPGSSGPTADEIKARIERMLVEDFGLPETVPMKRKLPRTKKKQEPIETHPLEARWSRPVFEDGMKSYTFDTKDRANIMQRFETIHDLAHAVGKISNLEGEKLAKAKSLLAEIDAILAKYGTDTKGIFEASRSIEDYGFDMTDVVQVSAVARAIHAIDADIIDKATEWCYASILSGLQTMAVNATAAGNLFWENTVGRGVEMAINHAIVHDPMGATMGEEKYILRAIRPALVRAMNNARVSFAAQHPMFDRDVNAMEVDWDRATGGVGNQKMIGAIGGKFGDFVRIPLRVLVSTDDFNNTFFACATVGCYAYRLAKMESLKQGSKLFGKKPGSPEFDRFIREMVNMPGSAAYALASQKSRAGQFANPLPGQRDPHTGKAVPVHDVGDFFGWVGAQLNQIVNKEQDNLLAKTLMAAFRVSFFPFQRTPFNILRKGVRYVPNPVSLFDILIVGNWQNKRVVGESMWSKKGWGKNVQGRNAELIERMAMQLQGSIAMLLLMGLGAGEGDEDDMKKPVVITGSMPWTPKGKSQLDAQQRSGLGPFRVSFRRKDGSERFGFNYGRIEPLATVGAGIIDLMKNVKRTLRGGGDASQAAGAALGGLVAQAKEKTFLRGLSDLVDLGTNMLAEPDVRDNRKAQQFVAGRFAMAIPNIVKQPIREMDTRFREKSDGFMQEMLYQAAPIGQKPEKMDPYGKPLEKTGYPVARIIDVADTGTNTVNPLDTMLLRWRDKHPDKAWFPSAIVNAEWKNKFTGKEEKMTQAQLEEFRTMAGKRAAALAKLQPFNVNNPTPMDIENIKKLHTQARADAKKILTIKFSAQSPRNVK